MWDPQEHKKVIENELKKNEINGLENSKGVKDFK